MSKFKKVFSAGIFNSLIVISGYSIYRFANIFLDKFRPNKQKLITLKKLSKSWN